VTEDCDGEELGSISIPTNSILKQARASAKKSQQLAQKKQSLLLMRKLGRNIDQEAADDDDEIIRKENDSESAEEDDDDQDKLLFESNFTEDKNHGNSFHSKRDEDEKQEESDLKVQYDLLPGHCSAKASFSTSKSSNADTTQVQWTGQGNQAQAHHHKFDEVLSSTHGDVSVIMRISDDQVLLNKILSLFKGLANQINLSLHGIK
jgi:hypothetical protein